MKQYKPLSHVAMWIISIFVILSGTTYALSHFEGFHAFIDDTILEDIFPHIQPINQGSAHSEVQMVVEAAITDHYRSLLVFSFINNTEEPWPEGTTLGNFDAEWARGWSAPPPTLSQNGRKLTYMLEHRSDSDILDNESLTLSAENIILAARPTEDIYIPLGPLFEENPIVLDTTNDSSATLSDYAVPKLNRMLKKELGSSQRQVLLDDPRITFEYMGMVQNANQHHAGLTLYTRSEGNTSWSASSEDFTRGLITEVTDIRDGTTYTADHRNFELNLSSEGALSSSQFSALADPSIIPYLVATEVTYHTHKVLHKEDWTIEFPTVNTLTHQPIETELEFSNSSQAVTIDTVSCSVLGVTLQGTTEFFESYDPNLLLYNIPLGLKLEDGSTVTLVHDSYTSNEGRFIANYSYIDENDELTYLNIDNATTILIDDEEIPLP